MPPESPEMLLQDTKNARVGLGAQRNVRIVIFVCVVIAIVTGLYRFWSMKTNSQRESPTPGAQALESTPIPKTNTFVDSLYGTVLFLQDGRINTVSVPDRKISQLLGVRGEETVVSLTNTTPAWSQEGKYLAIADQADHITVSEYDTGKYVGTYPIKTTAHEQQVTAFFDPFSEVLAIRSQIGTDIQKESVTFYALNTQKELGTYQACSGDGVWLKNYGYATRCAIGDSHSVVLIQFEPSSSVMIPLTRETKESSYTLIDEYELGKILALRTRGRTKDLVSLSVDGVVSALPANTFPKSLAITDLADPYTALKKRIEQETKMLGVKSVSVSSDNTWLAFERDEGIYIALIDLKEKPYFIGRGTLPSIRPN